MRILLWGTVATLATLAVARDSLRAQDVAVMAQAIPLVTRADPTATRSALTEGYLTQPVLMTQASWAWVRGVSTFNFEGLTLRRGELTTGAYGEGYVDRRHPHSYVHELLMGAEGKKDGWDASLFAGRGFAPFGSDDPMVRPFEKFPVNHHLAQVLERLVAIAALRRGPLIGEVGTFNGDEPTGPGAPPNVKRFGDSWAARLTVLPFRGAELSGSITNVTSPEVRAGHGLDQRKASLVARYATETTSSSRYAMIEWAHTGERNHGQLITPLSSVLGEAAACERGVTLALRVERSDRPEEEPLLDPFRTPRPPADLSNLGVSRWTIVSGALSAPAARLRATSARPFVEVERLAVAPGNPPGIFNALTRYGSTRMWMYSAGIRLSAAWMHGSQAMGSSAMENERMGRYGAALPAEQAMSTSSQHGAAMPSMSNMADMPGGAAPAAMSRACAR